MSQISFVTRDGRRVSFATRPRKTKGAPRKRRVPSRKTRALRQYRAMAKADEARISARDL